MILISGISAEHIRVTARLVTEAHEVGSNNADSRRVCRMSLDQDLDGKFGEPSADDQCEEHSATTCAVTQLIHPKWTNAKLSWFVGDGKALPSPCPIEITVLDEAGQPIGKAITKLEDPVGFINVPLVVDEALVPKKKKMTAGEMHMAAQEKPLPTPMVSFHYKVGPWLP